MRQGSRRMADESADPGANVRRIPPSDPAALADAAKRWSLQLQGQRFGLVAEGTVGPTSWTELELRSGRAYLACGLTPSDVARPRFEGYSMFDPVAELGYGYTVGEAGLRVASSGLLGVEYSSFVAMIQLWIQPALPKHSSDRTELPHNWVARVSAGQVVSSNIQGRHGPYRSFRGLGELEPGFEWVPRAVLGRLQSGAA